MAKMSLFEKTFVNSKLDYLFHKIFGIGRLLEHIDISDAKDVLEIGCGVGITSGFINQTFPNIQITATDYDQSQIERAKLQSVGKNIIFKQEDATKLSFSDNSFDTCFASFVFHHISNFPMALKEIHRILKPGARFYVMDSPFKTLNPLHKWITFDQNGLFTKREFISILESVGFRIQKIRGHLLFSMECKKL